MPITFEAAVDTLEWQHIYLNDAILTASYTTFRTNLVAFEPGFLGNPEIKLDHCTFESSDGFFATMGTDVSTSYLRNCVFRDLGMSWDDGSFVVYGGDIEISDCWFYNNGGNGIVLYEPLETVVSGTNSIANDLTGLLSWGVTSSASITCSEFSYNGGDSTSEVLILDGVVDFSNDAGNVFADKAGILLEGSAMENFELVDGGNGFYLFDSTGQYVYTGDETDTLDVGGNLWYPWTPDTSIFQDYFEPDTSRFWDWDQPAVALASCGVGQGFSMPGGGPIALVRPDQQTYGTSSHGGGKVPLGQMTKSWPLSAKSNLASKSMALESKYQDALADQKGGRYAMAKEKFGQFVNQNLNDARNEAALSRLMVSARKSGQVSGLVEFFAGVETRSESPRVKRAAKFLKLDAMTLEGRHQEAMNAYDDIITHPESRHDSLTAAIEATHLLFAKKDTKLSTSHPENQSSSALEMYRRILRLIAQHQRSKNAAIDGVEDIAIPVSYALYQNYPNPFNPNTEIRFDLPEAIHAELKVFNILGQEVVTLVDDVRAAGAYRVLWDGKNAAGLTVASGVYVYQIKTPNFTDAKKMMLIR
ncbi:MAG: T9SS type A sorting domain-containing protein [bacterium]|nr:T9SS type A sorting domain-containing protein [bacterium]